ncbi:MAG: hypothetical protein KC731_27480 [Myxococcales bacterium]|nr:hypothetical protein [Myxococcales bacterium]
MRFPHCLTRALGAALLLLLSVGCSKKSLLQSALEDPEERRDTFELTLQELDAHPEYVDELFEAARAHPTTFAALFQRAALALDDEALAREVAGHLANQPQAARRIMVAMLDEARQRPELREAIASAILDRQDVSTQILVEHPQIVQQALLGGIGVMPPPPPPVP